MCFVATLKLQGNVSWLKVNYRNTGFYIVHYGDDGWSALTKALSDNTHVLSPDDRASLIHNIFALSRQVYSLLLFHSKPEPELFQLHSVMGAPCGSSSVAFDLCVSSADRLGRVSFHQVLNLLNYMSNENETAPVMEALLQLNNIHRLLSKRQEQDLVARLKVLLLIPKTIGEKCVF